MISLGRSHSFGSQSFTTLREGTYSSSRFMGLPEKKVFTKKSLRKRRRVSVGSLVVYLGTGQNFKPSPTLGNLGF